MESQSVISMRGKNPLKRTQKKNQLIPKSPPTTHLADKNQLIAKSPPTTHLAEKVS
jgi:hypothetical protein